MKKIEYVSTECEVVLIETSDVIATSNKPGSSGGNMDSSWDEG